MQYEAWLAYGASGHRGIGENYPDIARVVTTRPTTNSLKVVSDLEVAGDRNSSGEERVKEGLEE